MAEWVRAGPTDAMTCAHATCTPKRFADMETFLRDVRGYSSLVVLDSNKTTVRFTHAEVRDAAAGSASARVALDDSIRKYAEELARELSLLTPELRRVSDTIALIDVHASQAHDARSRSMVRPRLLTSAGGRGRGRVSCQALRHPLIERLSEDVPYVRNSVELDGSGMLLYGVNAAGKSSMCKALAVAVVMAQAGMHVACSEMSFEPFGSLFTRMAARDDIQRGRSTFVVELYELREILTRADERTLIVGDELCCGTESASAASIVGASCLHIVKRSASFIFATHLHELSQLDMIADEPRISIWHLGVSYDQGLDALVYERRLAPGLGRALYGLEVAQAMHLGADFMASAHSIRRRLQGEPDDIVSTRTSHFNSRVYMDTCALCKKRLAGEAHHIIQQKYADAQGLVSADSNAHPCARKNARWNLVPLCAKCHDQVHAGKASISPPVQTTRGALSLRSC
jgi:DNA mismatch repair protein MutS